jgi:hypothetical protein
MEKLPVSPQESILSEGVHKKCELDGWMDGWLESKSKKQKRGKQKWVSVQHHNQATIDTATQHNRISVR